MILALKGFVSVNAGLPGVERVQGAPECSSVSPELISLYSVR